MSSALNFDQYAGVPALITGGLGFIGSNLAIRLVELGAHVTLVDSMLEGHGANPFNIEPVRDCVTVEVGDVRDPALMRRLVRDQAFVFHLAGYNDHVLGLHDPFPALDVNIRGAAVLLEACRAASPEARLVYTGTRGEYGTASMPAREDQAKNPRGVYELSSLTAQWLFRIYNDQHGLRSVGLRLANIYGERAHMRHDRFGVANWFLRQALDDATIRIFGDGRFARDFVYVQDAVDAILMSALTEGAYGETLNVGDDHPSNFRDLAERIVRVAGSGRLAFVPFAADRALSEPGDSYCDIGKIRRLVGWAPMTGIDEGLGATVTFYRKYKEHYW